MTDTPLCAVREPHLRMVAIYANNRLLTTVGSLALRARPHPVRRRRRRGDGRARLDRVRTHRGPRQHQSPLPARHPPGGTRSRRACRPDRHRHFTSCVSAAQRDRPGTRRVKVMHTGASRVSLRGRAAPATSPAHRDSARQALTRAAPNRAGRFASRHPVPSPDTAAQPIRASGEPTHWRSDPRSKGHNDAHPA